jgi:penicillin-binding protein 1C
MESQSSENSSSLNKGPIRSLLRHFLLALVVLMMVQVTISAYYMWKSETRSRQRSQVILDRLGHPLRHSFSDRGEKRNWQHLNELPPLLSQVFVASEDHRFFEHKGIDPLSLLRVVRDLLVDRQLRSGASTITMQLAKIYWPELKSKWHKGTQMLVALYLEQKMSKGDILSEYLNAVPFGFQRVGVGIACEFFFASSCSSLSPSQMAALAVIPRNPRHYTTNIEALLEMKNRLLIKLAHNIGKETLSLALKETVQLEFQPSEFIAPQFTRRIMAMNFDTEEVHSTLDYYLQREMQERFKNIVESTPKYGDSGALLIVDNRTHSVLVYIGSPDFFEPEIGQIDGVRAVRSPGSTMKPFLYAHAIENGYTLSDILPDIPMTFSIGQKVYEPSNYGGDYAGPVPIRRALANSKNIPALYLTNLLGAESVLESFKALGLSDTNLSGQHYGLGIAIGNLETTLWRLVQAYSVLANRGEYHPIAVLKGQTEPGYRLKDFETVSLITSVLSDHQSRSDDFGVEVF